MICRIGPIVSLLVVASAGAAGGEAPRLKVVSSKALPRIEEVTIYKSGESKPKKKAPRPLVSVASYADPVVLPGDGPFDVYAKPKGGLPVPVASKLRVKEGQTHQLKLGDILGTIAVFQNDDSPRSDRIVVTATDDPGPDEKGHSPIQVGSGYRVEMVVPEGSYAVWVEPANGARARRVADRVRVLAGKNVRVE